MKQNNNTRKGKVWTRDEEQYLIKWYDKKPTKVLSEELQRPEEGIRHKAKRLKLDKRRLWTEQEVEYIKHYYNVKSVSEIAKILHKSYSGVQKKASSLGLCEHKDSRQWTIEEEEYLENYYNKRGSAFIAKKFKRTEESIKRKAHKIGLNAYMGEELLVKQIAYVFNCDSRVINRWIDKFDLPCREFYRGQTRFRSIDTKTFWKWAENHKDIIPFNKYERHGLVPEPEWLKEIVKNSYGTKHRKPITSYDISTVRYMRNKGCSWEDIAKKLNRTIDSVKHISVMKGVNNGRKRKS